MNTEKRNKIVYGWFDGEECFYIGIGTHSRSTSKISRNQFCSNKRAKAEKNDTFRVEILFYDLTWTEACEKERELIEKYGRRDLGTGCLTNLTSGGEGCDYWKTRKRTKQTREKISDSLKGNNNGKGNKGNKHSEETKKKIRKSTKGKASLTNNSKPFTVKGVRFENLKQAEKELPGWASAATIHKRLTSNQYPEYIYL